MRWEYLDVTIQQALAEVMMHDFGRVAQLTEKHPFLSKIELLMASLTGSMPRSSALAEGHAQAIERVQKDPRRGAGCLRAAQQVRSRALESRPRS